MSNGVFVNDVRIPTILKNRMNQFIQDAMTFVENHGGRQDIKLVLDKYDLVDIADVYIYTNGCKHNFRNVSNRVYNIAMQLCAKYPAATTDENLYGDDIIYILDNFSELINDEDHLCNMLRKPHAMISIGKNNKLKFKCEKLTRPRMHSLLDNVYFEMFDENREIDPTNLKFANNGEIIYKEFDIIRGHIRVRNHETLTKLIMKRRDKKIIIDYDVTKKIPESHLREKSWKLGKRCKILKHAFQGWSNIQYVFKMLNFDNVENIDYAFKNCSGHNDLVAPEFKNVTSARYAFAGLVELAKPAKFHKLRDAQGVYKDCVYLINNGYQDYDAYERATSLQNLEEAFYGVTYEQESEFDEATFTDARLVMTYFDTKVRCAFYDCKFLGVTTMHMVIDEASFPFNECYFEHIHIIGKDLLHCSESAFIRCKIDKITIAPDVKHVTCMAKCVFDTCEISDEDRAKIKHVERTRYLCNI